MPETASCVVRDLQLTPAELKFYVEEGYLRLGGLVDPDVIDDLREEIIDVACTAHDLDREQLCHATASADKLRQSRQYLASMKLNELINGEAMISIASQLVGGPAKLYSPFTAVKAGGGGGSFDFHQDNNYTQHEPEGGSLNIWVALSDMSPENGCLQVIPRSHRNGQLPSKDCPDKDGHQQIDVDPIDCVPLRMRAGEAVAFSRWTVHGSGPNHTNEPRVAYALQYVRNDVNYLDKKTCEWRPIDKPLWHIGPVDEIGPYAGEK